MDIVSNHPWTNALHQWRHVIAHGNRCYQLQAWIEARNCYQQALAIAEGLMLAWPEPDIGMSVLVVSHHNLADTCLQLDQLDDAAGHLCSAHEQLQRVAQDPGASVDQQQAALRHQHRTLQELMRFAQRHVQACPCSLRVARHISEHLIARAGGPSLH